MTHTAELHTAILQEEYSTLITCQEAKIEGDKRRHIRSLAVYGITDICPHCCIKPGFVYYYCTAIINLERLANGGRKTVKTYQNESDFEKLAYFFSEYMREVLPAHSSVNGWTVARIDYNIDLRLSSQEEVEQYIILLQRGDKAYSWIIHETEEEKKKRKKSKHGCRKTRHPEGSVLYDNSQYSINIYDKHKEREQEQENRGIKDENELMEAERVLRIEVQTKRGKLQTLKKKCASEIAGKPLQVFARFEMAEGIITSAFKAIAGETDYVSMERAKKRIGASGVSPRAGKNMLSFLRLARDRQSVWNAKKNYSGDMKPESIIKRLNGLNINPVTIPKAFGKDEMKNLYHRICTQFAEEKAKRQNGY